MTLEAIAEIVARIEGKLDALVATVTGLTGRVEELEKWRISEETRRALKQQFASSEHDWKLSLVAPIITGVVVGLIMIIVNHYFRGA